MPLPFFQVDAFTKSPFAGNPAAVCLLDAARGEAWMQSVAAEMNLSETAFLVAHADSRAHDLRWFTPKVEVALCGHATLASAHVLFETGRLAAGETARFHSKSGVLLAARRDGLIELDFPATPAKPSPPPDGLTEALGVRPVSVGRSAFDYLVEVESEEEVREVKPSFAVLTRLPVRGVIVTARAGEAARRHPGADFVSRFFAPAAGVDEDPVTGSAHCCLAPFWAERLGRKELVGVQVSARGGVVHVRLDGDRVHLGGDAVTVVRGELDA